MANQISLGKMALDTNMKVIKLKPGNYTLTDFFELHSGISSFSTTSYPLKVTTIPKNFYEKLVFDLGVIWQKVAKKFFGIDPFQPECESRIRVRKRIEQEELPIPISPKTNGIKLVKSLLFGINEEGIWMRDIDSEHNRFYEELATDELPYFSNTFTREIIVDGEEVTEVIFHAIGIDWNL